MTKQLQRPGVLFGKTREIECGCGKMFITLNCFALFEGDKPVPFEVFIQLGKAGGCANANMESLARLISWGLRSGASLDEAIKHLQDIQCHLPLFHGAKSCADAVAAALMELQAVAGEKVTE